MMKTTQLKRMSALLWKVMILLVVFALIPHASPLASHVYAADWQLGLNISVPFADGEGGKATQALTAGTRLTASDGFDNTWDTVTYNSGTAMAAYFYHPEFATQNQRLARDFRFDDYPKQWDFYVMSDQDGQPVTMALNMPWPGQGSCLEMALSLTDVTAGAPVDLTQATYVYTNNAAVSRHFQLTATQLVQSPPPAPYALSNPLTVAATALVAWKGSLPDGAGYYLYRKNPDTVAYSRVTTVPLSVPKFLDKNLLPGTYSYLVTTVTTSGCESNPSNGVSVTVKP